MAIKGYVDGVLGGVLFGWAQDLDHPDTRVALEVQIDDEPAGQCVADVEREDLARAGIGDGGHGFRLRLARPLTAGEHRVIVRAAHGDGGWLPLAEDHVADEPSVQLTVEPTVDSGGELDGSAEPVDGRAGWRFPRSSPERFERALGRRPMTPGQVQRRTGELAGRHEHLVKLGIAYLVVTVPDKAFVYAEHLPEPLAPVSDHRPGAQLARALRAAPRLSPMDLAAVLRDARGQGRVFTRTGPELTWPGAFFAYRAIVKELAVRGLTGPPMPAERLVRGDLVVTGDGSEREPQLDRTTLGGGRADRPDAVLLHDGSGARLAPFLAEHFGGLTVLRTTELPTERLEPSRPAVVVQVLSDGGPFFD